MIRRGLLTLLVATMGLGLFAADPLLTRADSQYYISNLSVGVAGSTVTYDACVFAPVAAQGGMVVVSTSPDGSGSQYQVVLSPVGGCGGPTYALQGSVTVGTDVPAGRYYFQVAYAFLAPGGPLLPAAQRNVGFVSNFSGDTVATDCQVDFTTGAPQSPRNCAGPGVVGNVVGFGPPPPAATNTPLPPATPTDTAVPPAATTTPVPPAPTNSPAPTNTPLPPAAPSTGGGAPQPPAATNTSVPPAAPSTGGGAPQPPATPAAAIVVSSGSAHAITPHPSTKRAQPPGPTLHVTLLAPLVQPGAVQRIAVSYIEEALVQARVTFPGAGAVAAYTVADSHGHATLALPVPRSVKLHNGRATAQVMVRGVAGPWRWATLRPLVVQPGLSRQLTVSAPPSTPVRAVVTIPGMRPFTLFGTTGPHGHLTLTVTVPRSVKFREGHATALVAVATVAPRRQAQVRRTLAISDMVVGLVSSPIVSCWQLATVHVAYYPHAPLRIVLLLPHGQQLRFETRADGQGQAVAQVRLHYVRAASPVRLVVQVSDATRGAQRLERATVSVVLPQGCQKAQVPTVTVEG